jgi:hypothetical protein
MGASPHLALVRWGPQERRALRVRRGFAEELWYLVASQVPARRGEEPWARRPGARSRQAGAPSPELLGTGSRTTTDLAYAGALRLPGCQTQQAACSLAQRHGLPLQSAAERCKRLGLWARASGRDPLLLARRVPERCREPSPAGPWPRSEPPRHLSLSSRPRVPLPDPAPRQIALPPPPGLC